MASDDVALQLTQWLAERAIDGLPPLKSAAALATPYQDDGRYAGDDARIDALVRWEASKNFTAGFLTSLGGVLTLPVTLPSGMGAAWVLQTRLVAAVAHLCGHDLRSEQVRTLVTLSLVGGSANDVLKQAGVRLGEALAGQVLRRLPEKALKEVNKRVGFTLLGRGSAAKLVPVVGAVISGAFDAYTCHKLGQTAKTLFLPVPQLPAA